MLKIKTLERTLSCYRSDISAAIACINPDEYIGTPRTIIIRSISFYEIYNVMLPATVRIIFLPRLQFGLFRKRDKRRAGPLGMLFMPKLPTSPSTFVLLIWNSNLDNL